MGKSSLKDRVMEVIAGFGWYLFIKFQYGGNENRYFQEIRNEFFGFSLKGAIPERVEPPFSATPGTIDPKA